MGLKRGIWVVLTLFEVFEAFHPFFDDFMPRNHDFFQKKI